jgi:oxalate decarboxylase
MSSLALATAAVSGLTVNAQERASTQKAEHDYSSSDPGQENKALLGLNPSSNIPPPTDHGDVVPLWYSFDLVKKRVEEGGWTHEVTERELSSSRDIAGVNMRLTAGSYREMHWHTADEWAYVLYGSARITVMNPDGTMFIGDVEEGDLWMFPAGFPHSIQGSAWMEPSFCSSSTWNWCSSTAAIALRLRRGLRPRLHAPLAPVNWHRQARNLCC